MSTLNASTATKMRSKISKIGAALLLICIGNSAVGMGTPFINLDKFLADYFNLSRVSVDQISEYRSRTFAKYTAGEFANLTSLRKEDDANIGPELLCEDFEVIDYDEWVARNVTPYGTTEENYSSIPVDLRWDTWVNGAVADVFFDDSTFLKQKILRARATVAILGESHAAADFLDASGTQFRPEILQELFKVQKMRYERFFLGQLSNRTIHVYETIRCSGFTIFHLEIG